MTLRYFCESYAAGNAIILGSPLYTVEKERRTRKRERNILRKHISEMTPADKASFLETTKRALLLEQGVPWEVIEPKIQADIDATFDDAQFVKMDPDSRIDAAYARKEFGDKKPSLVDYMLWTAKFVTHSDVIEW